jgi:hypothetical protein
MQARNLENPIKNPKRVVGGGKDTWERVPVKEMVRESVEMDRVLGERSVGYQFRHWFWNQFSAPPY